VMTRPANDNGTARGRAMVEVIRWMTEPTTCGDAERVVNAIEVLSLSDEDVEVMSRQVMPRSTVSVPWLGQVR
jgi:hypothetical protein